MRDVGPEASFLTLLNNHQGVLHRIARAYSVRPSDREDLLQEIVFQLWRSYPAYRRESSPTTWVYRVSLNTAITAVRKRGRSPIQVSIEDVAEPHEEPRSGGSEPSQVAALHRAIRELGSIERALVMCYLDDLSYKRIAEILGISEANVGTRLTRIKAKLQALLAKQE